MCLRDHSFTGSRLRNSGREWFEIKFRLVDHIGSLDSVLNDKYKGVKVVEATKPLLFNIRAEIMERMISVI